MRAKQRFFQGIGITVGAASFLGVFVLGFSAGRASTGEFHVDVEKAAKRRLQEAADKVLKERREQRKFDAEFNDITKQ